MVNSMPAAIRTIGKADIPRIMGMESRLSHGGEDESAFDVGCRGRAGDRWDGPGSAPELARHTLQRAVARLRPGPPRGGRPSSVRVDEPAERADHDPELEGVVWLHQRDRERLGRAAG